MNNIFVLDAPHPLSRLGGGALSPGAGLSPPLRQTILIAMVPAMAAGSAGLQC